MSSRADRFRSLVPLNRKRPDFRLWELWTTA